MNKTEKEKKRGAKWKIEKKELRKTTKSGKKRRKATKVTKNLILKLEEVVKKLWVNQKNSKSGEVENLKSQLSLCYLGLWQNNKRNNNARERDEWTFTWTHCKQIGAKSPRARTPEETTWTATTTTSTRHRRGQISIHTPSLVSFYRLTRTDRKPNLLHLLSSNFTSLQQHSVQEGRRR